MPVPPLEDHSSSQHHDGRHRTWTVDYIPDYVDLPAYEPGMRSPVLVPLDGWNVNWLNGTLFVFRNDDVRHPNLDDVRFGTAEEAYAAAWAAGLLGLWVYEDVAHLYGLPSSLAWVRSTEGILTTDAGHSARRVGDARTVEWCRILDPALDQALDPEVWEHAAGNALYATFAVSAYGANNPDHFAADDPTVEYIEVEYGTIVSLADDDDTEVFSRYVYDTVTGATDASPDALDGYLIADMLATFGNLDAGDTMADSVWNGTVGDATLHLGAAA